MTEESTEYRVDEEVELLNQAAYLRHPEIWDKLKAMDDDPQFKRSRLIKTAYYQEVADTARAIIISGYCGEIEEIVDNAIALIDKLVERVGEKNNAKTN